MKKHESSASDSGITIPETCVLLMPSDYSAHISFVEEVRNDVVVKILQDIFFNVSVTGMPDDTDLVFLVLKSYGIDSDALESVMWHENFGGPLSIHIDSSGIYADFKDPLIVTAIEGREAPQVLKNVSSDSGDIMLCSSLQPIYSRFVNSDGSPDELTINIVDKALEAYCSFGFMPPSNHFTTLTLYKYGFNDVSIMSIRKVFGASFHLTFKINEDSVYVSVGEQPEDEEN